MQRDFYSFMDIIKLNDHNWEKAHFMLEYFQEKGLLIKEIRGPENIIYRVCGPLRDFDLLYDRKFKVRDSESQPMRLKRKRISE